MFKREHAFSPPVRARVIWLPQRSQKPIVHPPDSSAGKNIQIYVELNEADIPAIYVGLEKGFVTKMREVSKEPGCT